MVVVKFVVTIEAGKSSRRAKPALIDRENEDATLVVVVKLERPLMINVRS